MANRKKCSGGKKSSAGSKKGSCASKAKASPRSPGMRITSRIVNARRHTTGYIAGGKKYSVSQIRSMAANGRIKNVQVVGNHVQALPGKKRLTDLPMKVMK